MKTKERSKRKQDNLFKRWYNLCQPNKKLWFWQVFFHVVYAVLCACMTIFAAKTINYLYSGDWKNTFIWLAVEIVSILIREVFLYFHRDYYGRHYSAIHLNITRKIYDKILTVEDDGIKSFSSEKIINIAQNNVGYACDFPEYLSDILRFIIEIAVALFSVFTSNVFAGLVVLGLGVINFFVYNALNKKLGRIMNKRFAQTDKSFQEYSKIIGGKPVIEEMGAYKHYKNNLLNHVTNFNKEYKRYYSVYSFRNDIYYAIWNVVIYAITAVLIFMVSKNTLAIGVYLVIVPYLKSCTDKLNNLYMKFGGFEDVRVDVDRVNMILSLTNKQLLTYGDKDTNADGRALCFIGVSHSAKNSPIKLKDINFDFMMNSVNIVKGDRGCGKRVIFDILRRKIKPDRGNVLLDNLDLFDYNNATFKNHIDYCAAHPIFLNTTIKENLLIANKDFNQITSLVKELELEDKILKLPQGYNTNIEDVKDGETRFWIGLIRAAVRKSRILMIYEYPNDVSPDFHNTLRKIIATSERKKRTLIFFTHKDDYNNLADRILVVKDGKITQQKNS